MKWRYYSFRRFRLDVDLTVGLTHLETDICERRELLLPLQEEEEKKSLSCLVEVKEMFTLH